LYTLITRAADGDSAEVMTAIVEARDGADAHRWRELLAAPTTAVVTLTVTEAGYRRGQDGTLDLADPDVAADIQRLLGVGFTIEDVWDIAEVASMFNFTNRLAAATGQLPNREYNGMAR